MKNLKPTNRYRKALIENIVFIQGQDYWDYKDGIMGEWENPTDFLLQWYYPNEHQTNWYDAKDINTPFLGDLIKIPNHKGYFLFSENEHVGYIGLSRIIKFSMKIID